MRTTPTIDFAELIRWGFLLASVSAATIILMVLGLGIS